MVCQSFPNVSSNIPLTYIKPGRSIIVTYALDVGLKLKYAWCHRVLLLASVPPFCLHGDVPVGSYQISFIPFPLITSFQEYHSESSFHGGSAALQCIWICNSLRTKSDVNGVSSEEIRWKTSLVRWTSENTISFSSHKQNETPQKNRGAFSRSLLLPLSPSLSHIYVRRQLAKNEIAKQWLDHPRLHFTRRRHRKINCTNWVTEFIKLVFSFSTFIRRSLCESLPEVTPCARQLSSQGRRHSTAMDHISTAKARHSSPAFLLEIPLESYVKKRKRNVNRVFLDFVVSLYKPSEGELKDTDTLWHYYKQLKWARLLSIFLARFPFLQWI